MSYDEEQIKILEGLEAVRTRPGMYIGSTDSEGYHHLLWEVVDNSVDEAMAGHATRIDVGISEDRKTAWVRDNGRGIPFGQHASGMSTLDVVFCKLHAGGKFEGKGYKVSGGLHGVGAAVVNALSSGTFVESRRDNVLASRQYSRGEPVGKMKIAKEPGKNGTSVSFTPDPEIFGDELSFDPELVEGRLQLKAYLNPKCVFFLQVAGENPKRIEAKDGLVDLIRDTLDETSAVTPIYSDSQGFDMVDVNVALVWTEAPKDDLISFANGIPTKFGGTHLQGLREVVGKEVKALVEEKGKLPKKWDVTRDDIFEGVHAAIAVYVRNPQFQGQTKDRLNNVEVQGAVQKALRTGFQKWLVANESAVLTRVIQSIRARLASRDAQVAIRKSAVSSGPRLPGKLADCSSNSVDATELFLVEGDSAGGSAKQARDRKTQAILPLRGKVLNTEGTSLKKLMSNQEIKNIIDAIGCGIGPTFDTSRLRYGKIILLMDADTDGAHISVLVMTLFFRHLRQLIDEGRIYLAKPPLYSVKTKEGSKYAVDDLELKKLLRKYPKGEVTRFKGLGEMPPRELWATTMDPEHRTLLRLDIPEGTELLTDIAIRDMMGDDPFYREEMIMSADTVDYALD